MNTAMHDSSMTPIEVGLDDGYATTKIALAAGRVFSVPSRARVGAAAVTSLNETRPSVREYETGGRRYAAGALDGESTRFDDYPFSDLNRVIVQHALQEVALDGCRLHVVSGLPVSAFYHATGARRDDVIARKVANLLAPVEPTDGRPQATVIVHDVIPEALAAWYDHVISEEADGARVDEAQMRLPIAVIDIGGRTTDFVVVEDQCVIHRASGSLRCGMLDLKQRVGEALRARFALEELGERTVEDGMDRRAVRLFGQSHDITDLVDAALSEIIQIIYGETRRQLGRGAELERVLFVGGGAVALGAQIRDWFPNQVIAPMPAFANVRGMFKYQRYIA